MKINVILFIVFLCIIYFFDLPTPNTNLNVIDISLNMADNHEDNGINANVGQNATVNVNNPNISANVSEKGINNMTAAISSAGGATAGLKVTQCAGGTPASKIALGLGTMAIVQATTAGMSKILNNNSNNNSNNDKNNFMCYIANNNDNNDNNINNILNDYPLNLLVEIDLLLYAAILFLFIFFNIYLANYFTTINYSIYISNNRIGNLAKTFINRYINIWNKSRNYLLILTWILLFISIVISKIYLYIIINFYN